LKKSTNLASILGGHDGSIEGVVEQVNVVNETLRRDIIIMNANKMDLGYGQENPEQCRIRGNTNCASRAFPEKVLHPYHTRGSRRSSGRAKLVTLVRQRFQELSPKLGPPLRAHIGLPALVGSWSLEGQQDLNAVDFVSMTHSLKPRATSA
jgi:hypothetical protein